MRTLLIGVGGVAVLLGIIFVVIGLTAPSEVVIQHRRFIAAEPPAAMKVVADAKNWKDLFSAELPIISSVTTESGTAEGDKPGNPQWTFKFKNGKVWHLVETAYEPPHDLHLSGIDASGLSDLQIHVLLESGLRGGTVATFRMAFSPDGFVSKAESQLGYASQMRHVAIGFLDHVAKKLGVADIGVDAYIAQLDAEKKKKAAEAADGGMPDGGTAGATDGGTAAAAGH
jgi:hypothetical protein